MITISNNYSLKWRYKLDHKYQWSECGVLINVKSGRVVRKILNGGSVGYCINGRFISAKKLRSEIELIIKEDCPF
jgi:hypothetical protein